MYPRLFDIPVPFVNFSLPINTYGLFIAIGFLTGIFIARREARIYGEDENKIMDLSFYILIAAIIFSRLFYVFTFPQAFLHNPLEIFHIWKGGLVFYGGFIGALLAAIIYVRLQRLSFWRVGDIMVPALAIGHFFGRLGCFFAGCCYGKVCDLPWAVSFNHYLSLVPDHLKDVPLHPTQLYSAISNLSIFVILILLRRFKLFDGFIFWAYVLLYGISRSLIEILRGDPRGGLLFNFFSFSQSIGITMSVIAGSVLIYKILKSRAVS